MSGAPSANVARTVASRSASLIQSDADTGSATGSPLHRRSPCRVGLSSFDGGFGRSSAATAGSSPSPNRMLRPQ
eukprot:2191771-Prymnesium_polylepis.1